jgi:RNA 2',3'-cyclic 3'-phosphodiesterase
MRLFIAIDLPYTVLQGLQALLQDLPAGRPSGAEQIHLTLFFLGEVQEGVKEEIIAGLQAIAQPPFSLRVEGVGSFPSPHRPRILWAGFSPSSPLRHLKQQIDEALLALGFLPDKKPFHPHLTLARIKNPRVTGIPQFLQQHKNFFLEEFIVESFHLYSSKLTPKGAVYIKVKTFPLA